MATFRVGVGSFNIQDGAVGFGTDIDGLGNLRVKGVTKTSDIKVSGASTLTRYSGFAADELVINDNTTLSGEFSSFGDIVINVGAALTVGNGTTVVEALKSVSIGTHFSPPKGGIEERGEDFVEGMMRFNTDLNTMEFYNGNEWRQFTYVSDVQNSPTSRGRVVCWGGDPVSRKIISYVNIASRGNAISFGESLDTAGHTAGMSNAIRGVFAGRTTPSESIEYITLASEGNSIDFGDLTGSRDRASGLSSSTRGLIAGGRVPSAINIIDYIEIMTLGNALDFGDLTVATKSPSTTSNGTRGILAHQGTVAELTISSKGNSVDIGKDIFSGEYQCGGASSGTRGMWASGQAVGAEPVTESIRGVEIASAGNAIEFGKLTVKRSHASGSGSCTRGIWWGGWVAPLAQNVIDYVSIQSGGEAEDFGDLSSKVYNPGVASDCHGGIGGY
tara:strand:- start:51 stop:1385 length:1335 start_codon:yes stop_codon:yes gene_type:complete